MLIDPHRGNADSLEPDLLDEYGDPCSEAIVESALNHAKDSKTTISSSSESRARPPKCFPPPPKYQ